MANPSLFQAISANKFVVAPGIFEMISARLADTLGFTALYATGYGTVASHLGEPDAGIATYTDMIARMGRYAQLCKTPIIADGDTGYGGLLNVRHTVTGYEAAGVSAIQLEDQESPKKCGHTPGRCVIAADDMVLKLRVAADARKDPGFLIIARTDARTTLGLEEAIRRGRQYRDAGADIVFVESPESEAEMIEIGRSIDGPLLANMVEGGRTPLLSATRLQEIGFNIAIYPSIGFLSVAAALEQAYTHLRDKGSSLGLDSVQAFSFERMNQLMGFQDVWDFDAKWANRATQMQEGLLF